MKLYIKLKGRYKEVNEIFVKRLFRWIKVYPNENNEIKIYPRKFQYDMRSKNASIKN